MNRFLIACLAGVALSGCHPQDPVRTGLYAAARDVLPASLAPLSACLARRLPAQARQRAAPDGSWLLISDAAAGQATWELRLTRVDALHTELEIDASLGAPAVGEALAQAAAACAGQ